MALVTKDIIVQIESKPLFADQQDRVFIGELQEMICNCVFQENSSNDNSLIFALKSDYARLKTECLYIASEVIVNAQSTLSGNLHKFRSNLHVIPQAGFYGTFFQYLLTKRINSANSFKWSGCTLVCKPEPNITTEFLAASGPITNGWE